MGVNNQGIVHLANTNGGFPACRNRLAHISVTYERFGLELEKNRCKRCQRIYLKRQKLPAPDRLQGGVR